MQAFVMVTSVVCSFFFCTLGLLFSIFSTSSVLVFRLFHCFFSPNVIWVFLPCFILKFLFLPVLSYFTRCPFLSGVITPPWPAQTHLCVFLRAFSHVASSWCNPVNFLPALLHVFDSLSCAADLGFPHRPWWIKIFFFLDFWIWPQPTSTTCKPLFLSIMLNY